MRNDDGLYSIRIEFLMGIFIFSKLKKHTHKNTLENKEEYLLI
jgi:hypothetical protein